MARADAAETGVNPLFGCSISPGAREARHQFKMPDAVVIILNKLRCKHSSRKMYAAGNTALATLLRSAASITGTSTWSLGSAGVPTAGGGCCKCKNAYQTTKQSTTNPTQPRPHGKLTRRKRNLAAWSYLQQNLLDVHVWRTER